ncbi:MAG TPA: GRP family sugar transporter [Bacteroidales bacterium]|nr:GRP family sugar transporter [Bacteroidales bacterium]
MILVQNYTLAVLLCVLAMICWGSWQNTQNLTGKGWRFELYYWDFILGIFIFSLIMAFTFGSLGHEGRPFLADLRQASPGYLISAALGGAIWNLGTLLLIAAISIAGMSVAFPIGGGIGWILGIVINYIGMPEGNPVLLFGGSAIIILAIIFSMISYRRLANAQHKAPLKGILLSFAAGLMIAFFYRFVASSLDTTFTAENSGKITSYTAVVIFSIGAIISTVIFNPLFMRYPIQGDRVSIADYLKGNYRTHFFGMLGGAIWCLGNSVSFMAVNSASPAISYGLSNSAPVVAAIWGIFVWKEFREAPTGTSRLLTMMFICYLIGLSLIVYSRIG